MKNTIKAHRNFYFGENAPSVPTPAFVMLYRPKLFEKSQYGLVANKKLFPTAVERNKAKRKLRVWISQSEMPANYDVIFISRPAIFSIPDGQNEVKKALSKLPSQ